MTFSDKVKYSEIVEMGYLRKGVGYKPPKKRIVSLIFAIILAAYTILMCYLGYEKHKDQYSNFIESFYLFMLIAPVFLAILKVIFSIIFVFIKNSIYSINHYQTYKFIKMLSDIDMILILTLNIFNYVYFAGHDVNLYWDKTLNFFENMKTILSKDNRDLLAFLVTIIINLPIIFNVICFTFKNGGIVYSSIFISPLWPIFFIKYLKNTKDDFYEYTSYDENYYEVHHRVITKKFYRFGVNLTKFTFVALIAFAGMLAGNFIPIKGVSNIDFYNRLVGIGIGIGYCIAGAIINYAYFYDLRQSMAIDKHARRFAYSLDDINEAEKIQRKTNDAGDNSYDTLNFF